MDVCANVLSEVAYLQMQLLALALLLKLPKFSSVLFTLIIFCLIEC